jgi:hypothetical protein
MVVDWANKPLNWAYEPLNGFKYCFLLFIFDFYVPKEETHMLQIAIHEKNEKK